MKDFKSASKTIRVKKCNCLKHAFKLRDVKIRIHNAEKSLGHPMYYYRCPDSRYYHMTKKPKRYETRKGTDR